MSENVKTYKQLMEEAVAAFEKTNYTKAGGLFLEAVALKPEATESSVYALVCPFMSGDRTAERLAPLWEQMKEKLAAALEAGDFAAAVTVKKLMANCTAAVYRNCNDHQMVEYAMLNKDVKLEKKEFIFDEIRRVLLEADEQYKICLLVMREFGQMACDAAGQEKAEDEFFLQTLNYIQAAVDLQNEAGLTKEFSALDLAQKACTLSIREDMDLALEARNKLLQTVLHGEPALERWETLGQYAEAAGVTRKSLEKEAKVAALKEKLKFWKYLKKIK